MARSKSSAVTLNRSLIELPSKIANWIISKVTGFPVHGLGCSLKAIRTEIARQIRDAFVAEPGHVLLSADYSQIELRLAAHMADVPQL